MQGTCEFHVRVDDREMVSKKATLKKLERELRKIRSEFLSASATLRNFQATHKFVTSQLVNASRAEQMWMALFMITLLTYLVHITVIVN